MKDNLFNAAAMVLSTIWYAKDHINIKSGEIYWHEIEKTQSQIMPSDTEIARVGLAKQLYQGHGGIVDLFTMLDSNNQTVVLHALHTLVNKPWIIT